MERGELERIERRLLRERERTLRAVAHLREEVQAPTGAVQAELGRTPTQLADVAAAMNEREKSFLLRSREDRYLWRIEEALRRLYASPESFGLCHACGREIPFERLEALPHVRYCLDCKLREEAEAA